MSHDALHLMLTDLRKALPTNGCYLDVEDWLNSVAQVIAAYPTELRRGAAAILVGNDLCLASNRPLDVCVALVLDALGKQEVRS